MGGEERAARAADLAVVSSGLAPVLCAAGMAKALVTVRCESIMLSSRGRPTALGEGGKEWVGGG